MDVSRPEERAQFCQRLRELERLKCVGRGLRDAELTRGDKVPQIMHLREKKATPLELEGDTSASEQGQHSFEMLRVLLVCTRKDAKVIQIY